MQQEVTTITFNVTNRNKTLDEALLASSQQQIKRRNE